MRGPSQLLRNLGRWGVVAAVKQLDGVLAGVEEYGEGVEVVAVDKQLWCGGVADVGVVNRFRFLYFILVVLSNVVPPWIMDRASM